MSWSEILKNIYTFANILSQAGTDAVKHWDERSLTNAFIWARLCQKIADQATGKTFSKQLDRQVEALTLFLNPVSLLHLDLDKLSDSVCLLQETLLLNPATPDHVFETILNSETKNTDGENLFVKLCSGLVRKHEKENALRNLSVVIGGEKMAKGVSVTAQACLILRTLHRLLSQTTSRSRFTSYLERLLEELVTYSDGWEIVAYLMVEAQTCQDLETSLIDDIIQQIVQWIINTDSFQSGLWQVDPDLLCRLTTGQPELLDLYLGHLINWGENMEPVYGLTDTGDLYFWRYSCKNRNRHVTGSSEIVSFTSLKGHVYSLLKTGAAGKLIVIKTLTDLANTSHFHIWNDLLAMFKKFAI